MNWKKREAWICRGVEFTVEIKHWVDEYTGNNKWNVYAHIFPGHRFFNELTESMTGNISIEDYFHAYISFVEWKRDQNGKIITKTYGSDYAHSHDDCTLETKIPAIVQGDAEKLFKHLEG